MLLVFPLHFSSSSQMSLLFRVSSELEIQRRTRISTKRYCCVALLPYRTPAQYRPQIAISNTCLFVLLARPRLGRAQRRCHQAVACYCTALQFHPQILNSVKKSRFLCSLYHHVFCLTQSPLSPLPSCLSHPRMQKRAGRLDRGNKIRVGGGRGDPKAGREERLAESIFADLPRGWHSAAFVHCTRGVCCTVSMPSTPLVIDRSAASPPLHSDPSNHTDMHKQIIQPKSIEPELIRSSFSAEIFDRLCSVSRL